MEIQVGLTLAPAQRAVFIVDLAGIESLDNVAVEIDAPGTTQSVPFNIEGRPKARAISWDVPPGEDLCNFRLSYKLTGVVSYEDDRDEASWTVIAEQNEYSFESVAMTVLFPASIPKERIHPSLRTAAATTTCVVHPDALKVAAVDLPARSSLRLQLSLPKGTIERRFFLNRFMKTAGGTILMFLLPALVFAGLVATFWLRGRDPSTGIDFDESARPSAGLTAEIAGTVFDEFTEPRDIVAGALELALKGNLRFMFQRGEDSRLAELCPQALKPPDNLRPHEKMIAEMFAGAGGVSEPRVLAADRCLPRDAVRTVRKAIYRQTAEDGYFRANPATERLAYSIAGLLIMGAGIAFLAWSAPSLKNVAGSGALLVLPVLMATVCMRFGNAIAKLVLGCAAAVVLFVGLVLVMPMLGDGGMTWFAKVGWGLVISSLFFFAFGPMMPQRTWAGATEKARLIAFRAFAASEEPDATKPGVIQAQFERFLPFAVALRFKKEWVNKFASAGVRAPAWWTIVPVDSTGKASDEPSLAQVKQEFLETLSILATAVGESPTAGSGG